MIPLQNAASAFTIKTKGIRIFQAIFITLLFLACIPRVSATVYYSKTSGDWNNPDIWTGGPEGDYPASNDIVYIKDGHIITLTGDESCKDLYIGGGVSGMLLFGGGGDFMLTIGGNINISKGGTLQYSSNNGRKHDLEIKGDMTNEGMVRLFVDKDDFVSMTFIGSSNSVISGPGTWGSLACMSVYKNLRTSSVTVRSAGFGKAITAGAAMLNYPYVAGQNPPVVLLRGTFIYDCPDNLGNLIDAGSGTSSVFTINPEVTVQIEQGSVDFATFPGSKANGYCILQGQLMINGGIVTVSKNAKTKAMAGIYYSGGGRETPKITINGGEIVSYGAFAPETANYDEIDFTMSGGTFNVNVGNAPSSYESFWITDRAGSSVNFTGGTVVINKKSTYESAMKPTDFDIGGTNNKIFNVTDLASVQFGSNTTPASQTMLFTAYANVNYPHVVLHNPGKEKSITVKPYNESNYNFLSLYIEENQVFENKNMQTGSEAMVMTIVSKKDMFSLYDDGKMKFAKGTIKFSRDASTEVGGVAMDNFE
jgi:hypothetical protein